MAGSLSHIIGPDGRFRMDLIENLGDAWEALEECFILIYVLSGGESNKVSAACRMHNFSDPWEDKYGDNPKDPMRENKCLTKHS